MALVARPGGEGGPWALPEGRWRADGVPVTRLCETPRFGYPSRQPAEVVAVLPRRRLGPGRRVRRRQGGRPTPGAGAVPPGGLVLPRRRGARSPRRRCSGPASMPCTGTPHAQRVRGRTAPSYGGRAHPVPRRGPRRGRGRQARETLDGARWRSDAAASQAVRYGRCPSPPSRPSERSRPAPRAPPTARTRSALGSGPWCSCTCRPRSRAVRADVAPPETCDVALGVIP